MRIDCPWCGPRPLEEFNYSGDATPKRPSHPETAEECEWVNYVYLRENPAGLHVEQWQHVGGCRSWLTVERDTRTHRIHSVKITDSSNSGNPENLV